MRKFINTNLTRHVLFWIAYTLCFYIINPAGSDNLSIGIILLTVPYFASVFYTVYYLLETFFRHRKYLIGALSLLVFYTLSIIGVYGVMYGGLEPSGTYQRLQLEEKLFS